MAQWVKNIYYKSLSVNFVRMFKINTRKLWQIKTNKQLVINTNLRKYRFFGSINPSQHLFLMCYCTAIYICRIVICLKLIKGDLHTGFDFLLIEYVSQRDDEINEIKSLKYPLAGTTWYCPISNRHT